MDRGLNPGLVARLVRCCVNRAVTQRIDTEAENPGLNVGYQGIAERSAVVGTQGIESADVGRSLADQGLQGSVLIRRYGEDAKGDATAQAEGLGMQQICPAGPICWQEIFWSQYEHEGRSHG